MRDSGLMITEQVCVRMMMQSMTNQFFKDEFTLEQRIDESTRVRQKYPDRIPVICERARGCTNLPPIQKRKYLVPVDLTVGQFLYLIRKSIHVGSELAMFLFVKNQLPPTGENMVTLDADHRSDDGFLYLSYSGENTFGFKSSLFL
jgi:GABA(A) receptor-associated protein